MPPTKTIRHALVTLLVATIVAFGAALSPAPAHAVSSGHTAAAAYPPNPFTPSRAYDYAYSATIKHYHRRPVHRFYGTPAPERAALGWGWPDMPDWIQEGGWWIKKAAKCGIGVGTFVALGGTTKVATMIKKIRDLSKSNKKVREAREAAADLGGFKSTLHTLGRYAKSKGKGVTSAEKAHLKKFVISGGSIVAEILGVTACFEMARKVL